MEENKQRKKLLILAILEILKNLSDQEHPLRQKDIMAILTARYGLTATRKSVGTNVQELIKSDYPIDHNSSGWYYVHEFSVPELDMLMDAVLANGALPYNQQADLLKKLRALGSTYYRPLSMGTAQKAVNPSFFLNLELLHEAINRGVQVSFHYVCYDVDKKLHPKQDENGQPKEYICNPYRVVANEGKSYLVCNKINYDNLIHFRVDHLADIRLLDTPCRPVNQLDLEGVSPASPEYTLTHSLMFSGKPSTYRIYITRDLVHKVLEQFGLGVTFENVTDTGAEALVYSDELSLKQALGRFGEGAMFLGEEAGRLPEAPEAMAQAEAPAEIQELGLPPRKKRGRPKRQVAPEEAPAKRRPGRPRKEKTETEKPAVRRRRKPKAKQEEQKKIQ